MNISSISEIQKESLNDFDCRNEKLYFYFKNNASQNHQKNISKTFVLCEENKVIGYYSLSNAQIAFENQNEEMRKKLPRYPIPSIRIARLAVSKENQRKKIGSLLMKDAFLRILRVSEQTGVYFVIVDSKNQAKPFYEHFGFMKLDSFSLTMLLPLSTIKKAMNLANPKKKKIASIDLGI